MSNSRINHNCQLSTTGCCYMEDKRVKVHPSRRKGQYGLVIKYPYITTYNGYVDRRGKCTKKTVCWIDYCESCKDYWDIACGYKNPNYIYWQVYVGTGGICSTEPIYAGETPQDALRRVRQVYPNAYISPSHTSTEKIAFW